MNGSPLRAQATAILFAVACGIAQAQRTEPVRVLERHIVRTAEVYARHAAPPAASREFGLTLIYFFGGVWSREDILAATGRAAEILGPCGVKLAQAELVLVDAPRQYHYFDTPVSRELARALQPAKPAIYFVTDTRQQPAFDAEAIGKGNSKTRPELADSVWMTRATRDPGIALAHELAHVLMDSGEHVEEKGSLMREDTAPENTRLSAAQCAQLRETAEKNGLLRRVAE